MKVLKVEIPSVMREAYERRWISMRDGNISVRDGRNMVITPSGVRKYAIELKELVKAPIDDVPPAGASIEFDMHQLILKTRPDANAVVHLHPTNVVAAMHAGFDLQSICEHFPELHRYTKVGPTVPTFPPGSNALALQSCEAIGKFDIIGQASHGVTAVGKDPWDAFEHIERLDHICEIVLKAYAVQNPNTVEHRVVLDGQEKED